MTGELGNRPSGSSPRPFKPLFDISGPSYGPGGGGVHRTLPPPYSWTGRRCGLGESTWGLLPPTTFTTSSVKKNDEEQISVREGQRLSLDSCRSLSSAIIARTAFSTAKDRLAKVRSSTFLSSHSKTSGGRVKDMVSRFLFMQCKIVHDSLIFIYCVMVYCHVMHDITIWRK